MSMNKVELNKVIGNGNIVIPLYILKYFKKLNLTMDEFMFLMYLYNRQDEISFNPEKISCDLNLDIMEVMGYISVLTDKGYLTLEVVKGENNILDEIINLSSFYEKISTFVINSCEEEKEKKTTILEYVEQELGRPLNSIEIATIKDWKENNLDDSLIKEALKMALSDGVYSLKYIDKVLFDWSSRGYKSVLDLKNANKETKEEPVKEEVELVDWNWLDDEEEYIVN